MDLRALVGARERMLGLALLVPTLVLGSLLAAAAFVSAPLGFLLAAPGVGLAFASPLPAPQMAGLVFLALARNRRTQDRLLFLSLGLGFLLSLLPVFFMAGGGTAARGVLRFLVGGGGLPLSPLPPGGPAARPPPRGGVRALLVPPA